MQPITNDRFRKVHLGACQQAVVDFMFAAQPVEGVVQWAIVSNDLPIYTVVQPSDSLTEAKKDYDIKAIACNRNDSFPT
ncbi:MAG: hypothetical protein IPG23_13660 [Burkholderiales bacterium]|jgi:hypothetical protein|nr:hypothetical protein [Burkholderiales bacterium]